jgi:hypothetical protein
MFRIRLASGEEAVFRTVDELALAIQSGSVTAGSEIFHSKSQRWLSIKVHPAYSQAAALASTLPVPPPPPGTAEVILHQGSLRNSAIQIYQMFSQSARELEERRRPRWLVPLAIVLAAAAAVAAVVLVLRAPGTPELPAVRPAVPPRQSPVAAPQEPLALSSEVLREARNTPFSLANRMHQGSDSAGRALQNSAQALGIAELLDLDRLKTPDTVRARREALKVFRPQVEAYRAFVGQLARSYEDSAAMFLRTKEWSRIDAHEWRVRAAQAESPGSIARADSLFDGLDRLYGLLLIQAGAFTVDSMGIRFVRPAAALEYERLRVTLRRLAMAPTPEIDPPSPPLTILLSGTGPAPLPERAL